MASGGALLATLSLLVIAAETEKTAATNNAVGAGIRVARNGACAATLKDGNILITGGNGGNGPQASAELFSAKQGGRDAAPMAFARQHHACAALPDGRVLVSGGATNGGGSLNSAEIFDPRTGRWSSTGAMVAGRAGAAAVSLANGRVLIAGGESNGNATATLEVFDPGSGRFTAVPGLLSVPRMQHATVALGNGRVLIAGGTADGRTSHNSIDVYDAATNTVSPFGARLAAARAGLSATTLLDGRVLFAGGSDGRAELSSTEIYNPKTGAITPGVPLLSARSGHVAVRVPNNNSVLFTGGNVRGGLVQSHELFIPWQSRSKLFGSTGPGAKAVDLGKALMAASGLAADGETPVLPTLATDKPDYVPGEIAQITGSGWPANSTVTFVLVRDPQTLANTTWTAAANAAGDLATTYEVVAADENVTFTLTATAGDETAQISQTISFTDSVITVNVTSPSTAAPATISTAGGTLPVSFTYATSGPPTTADVLIGPPGNPVASATGVVIATGGTSGSPLSATVNVSVPSGLTVGSYNLRITLNTNTNPNKSANADQANAVSIGVVDNTPPVITPSVTGTLGNNGWYTSAVNVSWTVTDAQSTVSSTTGCGPTSVTSDTTGTTFTCQATSAGGTSSQSVTIKRDATAPTLTYSAATGTLGANGWYTSNVSIPFTTNDATSGVASANPVSPLALTTEGANVSGTVSVTDNAGNSASFPSAPVKIDKTAPVIVFTGRTAPNPAGWNNTDVILTWSCADSVSGATASSVSATLTAEGASLSSTGTCADNAGNTAQDTQINIKIDKTAPTLTFAAPTGTTGSNGWYTSNVLFAYTTNDLLSGVAASTPGSPLQLTAEGPVVNGTVTVTDVAGNSATFTSATVKIDKTLPVIAFVSRTPANAAGWNNTDVTVNWSCTDTGSGVVSPAVSNTLTAEGAAQSSTGTCTDNAGLTAQNTQSGINIDKTKPVAATSAAPAANAAGWNNTDVTVTFSATDALSGVAPGSCTAPIVVTAEGSSLSAGPGTCADLAGNVSDPVTRTGIKIDKTAPTLTFAAPTGTTGSNGWYTSNVLFAYTTNDLLSGVATSTPGSPLQLTAEGPVVNGTVTVTDVAGNSATFTSATVKIDKTLPVIAFVSRTPANAAGWNNTDVTVNWSCTDTGSGVVSPAVSNTLTAEGAAQSSTGTCTDNAGLTAQNTQSGINIDKTKPVAAAAAAPPPNSYGWNNTNVNVSFSGTDALSGIDACDPSVTVSTEGANQTSPPGTCRDRAGNVSDPVSKTGINIDKTSPTIALDSRLPAANANGWNNTNVVVTWACADSLSGVVLPAASSTLSAEAANQSTTGTCNDKAGNSATNTQTGISIDKTAPVITITTPPNGAVYLFGSLVNANYGCADLLSGTATCAGTVANGAWIATTPLGPKSFAVSSTDLAGNAASLTNAYGINAIPTSTAVTVTPNPVQYSDEVTLKVTVTPTQSTGGTLTGSVAFTIGGVPVANVSLTDAIAGKVVQVLNPAAAHTVQATFTSTNSAYLGSSGTASLTVNKEIVNLDYTGDSVASAPAVGGSASFLMNAGLTESDAVLGTQLGNVTVKFTLKNGGTIVGSCTSGVKAPVAGKTSTNGCTIPVPGIAGPTLYDVVMEIVTNDYYEGTGEGAATAIIAVPGFTSGGGWFLEPLAGGGVGDRVNLGINATYQDDKKKTGARGNATIIRRAMFNLRTLSSTLPDGVADYNFIVKSNATTTYTQACTGTGTSRVCTSTFAGKATVKAVNRATGVAYDVGAALGGSVQFQIDVTDAGEPGTGVNAPGPDKFAARVWNSASTLMNLDTTPADTVYQAANQIVLNGGNIKVTQ